MLDTGFADLPPEMRAKLRVVYETPPMAPHALMAHPRVSAEDAGRLVRALVSLAGSKDAGLLASVHLETPVEADYARDYAPLEPLMDVRPFPSSAPGSAAKCSP